MITAGKRKPGDKGFTLVELMVVVTVIAILVTIAVPNFMGAITRAKLSKAFAEMRNLGNAIEMFWIDHGAYPTSSSDLTGPGLIYITSIPTDIFNKEGTRSVAEGALAEGSYGYYVTADTAWLLVSNGPDTNPDVTSEDIDWTARTVGQLGGWEGAETGYGYDWYDPRAGLNTTGDLGVSGP